MLRWLMKSSFNLADVMWRGLISYMLWLLIWFMLAVDHWLVFGMVIHSLVCRLVVLGGVYVAYSLVCRVA
jgi:hypothetical protein